MSSIIQILIALIAVIHCYIFWFQFFSWEKVGQRVFKSFPPQLFRDTKILAANQGLYNGFMAAGLIWSFWIEDPIWSMNIAVFFLTGVVVVGIYGAVSAERRIFFVQALPALIALMLIILKN